FHTRDYWVFAARTADASVEVLQQAPPRAIRHHYARLAIISFPATVDDCRVLWPPPFGERGCDCTICVTPESHNGGALTIQKAVEEVKATGGKICLAQGTYFLRAPVQIDRAGSITLQGRGWK